MTGYTVNTGTSKKFAESWDKMFGSKKSKKKATKKVAKKKVAKKKGKKK